jgi:CheY-like chemotaxis protein/CHASE3 domain sensor protein
VATLAGFLAALIALVVIAFLSYRSLELRGGAAARGARTVEVIDQLDAVLATLRDAETGQRGYLLTGDEAYLEPYAGARAALEQELTRLRELLGSDPDRMRKVEGLGQVAMQKMAEAQKTIDQRRAGKTGEALTTVRTDRGRMLMERARALAGDLRLGEEQARETHNREWQRAVATSVTVTWVGSAVLLFLLLGAASLTARDFRARAREAWMRAGQAAVAGAVQGDRDLESLGARLMPALAHTLDAQVGALYIAEADGRFQRFGSYALPAGPGVVPSLRPGDGLCGQAAKENRVIHVTDIPEDYLPIGSAMGGTRPRHLVIAPAAVDGVVYAVVELGFLAAPGPAALEMLGRCSDAVAVAVRSARDRSRLEELLDETQRQAEELQAQQQELRAANEELERQSQVLQDSQARLEGQQVQLEQSNRRLEEQARRLESQRDDLLVAERQLTEKAGELERASRYKSEFLANMSHELRTPLNASLIMSRLLAENREGNLTPEQVKFAETIASSGNDLSNLINDVLDLAKIDAGKVEVVSEPVDVAAVLQSLADMFETQAHGKGIGFEIALDEGAPRAIETDSHRLRQILKNLLSNAFKFTERGRILMTAHAAGPDGIAIAVSDSGIGITAAQQQVIFEAFRQADGTTQRRYGGTGLGLSISRDLAHLLGGEVTVASTPGEGSTFTLTLPRVYRAPAAGAGRSATSMQPPALAPAPALAAEGEPPAPIAVVTGVRALEGDDAGAPGGADDDRDHLVSGGRSILIIEDDRAFAGLVADLARELHFQCLLAPTADEGVALARAHRPSAVVLDMTLPDHSGLSVLDQLKRLPETRHIPVHVVSASDYTRTALTMGAAGYLLKPVAREELAGALRRLEARLDQKMRRVLIVEDNAAERQGVARLLAGDEVETVAVETAAEALQRLRETTFDCIVMDLRLPDASGFELLERMMERGIGSLPPVIVHTGRSLSADEEQRLRRYSRSIIIKGARSPERLLDEVTLFLHQVEARLPPDRQRMLRRARDREEIFEARRILVVEDDVRNVFALSSIFEPRGAKIDIARNGREALDRLGSTAQAGQSFDLVLMDIMMPEMDGLTAIREIRKRSEWTELPIIALTAKAMKDDQETCLAAGANDYLAKPLDLDKLLSLARIWMAR